MAVTERNTVIRVKDEDGSESIQYPVTKADNIIGEKTFDEATTRENIASGDSLSTLFGKIKKFFTDLKAVAFSGSYSDLSGVPTSMTPTSHASTATTYGAATGTYYGHTRLSASTSSTSGTSSGYAATPSAVKAAYDLANAAVPSRQKGAANGVATLDDTSKVPIEQIPDGVGILPRIEITTASGTKVTVTNGTTTFTKTSTGTATFDVPSFGDWTITAGNHKAVLTIDTVKIYSIQPLALSLSDATWAQISEISKAGYASMLWSIGDEKDITVNGETLTLQIYGFNHDNLTGGGKAGITFGLKNLMATKRRMNASNTYAGGFTGSEMYTWLQGDLLSSLPADLQTVIKSVNKKTSAGSQSTTINTDSMKLFLFSAIENGLRTTEDVYKDEGETYPIFTDDNSRIKYLSNGSGSVDDWWERSPLTTALSNVCLVNKSGSVTSIIASGIKGVCFGFCV